MSQGLPGDGLYRFLARVVSEEILRDIVAPTIADLQHEATNAGENSPRYWQVRIQGSVALIRVLVSPRLWWQSKNGVKVMRTVALIAVGLCLALVIGLPRVVGRASGAQNTDIGPLPPIQKPNHVVFDRVAEAREAFDALQQAMGSAGERAAQDRYRAIVAPGMSHEEYVAQTHASTEKFVAMAQAQRLREVANDVTELKAALLDLRREFDTAKTNIRAASQRVTKRIIPTGCAYSR